MEEKAERVTFEKALNEFNAWLDYKKVSNSKRESLKDVQDEIIDAIVDGHLSIDSDTFEILYKLKLAPEKGGLTEIKFQARVSTGIIDSKLRGVALNDAPGRVRAYACAITGLTPNDFRVLDTADWSIVSDIVAYFF